MAGNSSISQYALNLGHIEPNTWFTAGIPHSIALRNPYELNGHQQPHARTGPVLNEDGDYEYQLGHRSSRPPSPIQAQTSSPQPPTTASQSIDTGRTGMSDLTLDFSTFESKLELVNI
jgi:hypothetical protein